MPIYGRLPVNGEEATCSGLLRSTDSGQTWGDSTAIACGCDGVTVEYGPTAVHADPSGTMLAMISAEHRYLYRSTSGDGARTWSSPDQRLLACNPILVALGSTLACVGLQSDPPEGYKVSEVWPISVQFSEDLFDSWRCNRIIDNQIRGEYCSAVALDTDCLLLAHDRVPFAGTYSPPLRGIEVAMMQRNPAAPPVPNTPIAIDRRDRWQLERTFATTLEAGFGEVTLDNDGTPLAWSGGGIHASGDSGQTFTKIGGAPKAPRVILPSGWSPSWTKVR